MQTEHDQGETGRNESLHIAISVGLRLPETLSMRRGMEMNHHVWVCRPFPFRFGFRSISHNIECKQGREMRAAILRVPFHKVPPPKESMKEFLET
jgi:hypothetical protein